MTTTHHGRDSDFHSVAPRRLLVAAALMASLTVSGLAAAAGWTAGPAMTNARAGAGSVTLPDGRVILVGGTDAKRSAFPFYTAELYNPTTNAWTATTMSRARTAQSVVQLANGLVIVCGGAEGLLSAPVTIDAVASLDPITNVWTDLAPLTAARAGHTAAVLPDGLLVLLGGSGDTSGEALHF